MNTLLAWVSIVSMVVGVAVAIRGAWRAAAKQREEDAQAKQATYNKGFEDGKAHMQPTIDLLTSQVTDCRRDLDESKERANRYEDRYNSLRDRNQ